MYSFTIHENGWMREMSLSNTSLLTRCRRRLKDLWKENRSIVGHLLQCVIESLYDLRVHIFITGSQFQRVWKRLFHLTIAVYKVFSNPVQKLKSLFLVGYFAAH